MKIGVISSRLNGTDGVSLEVEKWVRVLEGLGHEICYCAGELGGYAAAGTSIESMHFEHPTIRQYAVQAFQTKVTGADKDQLLQAIEATADELFGQLQDVVHQHQVELLLIENAMAIPMNLPLGMALARLIEHTSIPALAHNHDYFWERERYQNNGILPFLDTWFPADLPSLTHVSINSIAQQRLKARRGIDSVVVPNVHDFATPPTFVDDYNQDLRQQLGLRDDELFILQPTRVVQRKGIELAVELIQRLQWSPNPALLITHSTSDEGNDYWQWLQHEAQAMGVPLRLVEQWFATERTQQTGQKVYSLWDAYPHADLVTYPSLYEGFGNALLEAVYYHCPVVVNRYAVYNADIRPHGFDFVELHGYVDSQAVDDVAQLLKDSGRVKAMAETNYACAQQHFSFAVLEEKLTGILNQMGLPATATTIPSAGN